MLIPKSQIATAIACLSGRITTRTSATSLRLAAEAIRGQDRTREFRILASGRFACVPCGEFSPLHYSTCRYRKATEFIKVAKIIMTIPSLKPLPSSAKLNSFKINARMGRASAYLLRPAGSLSNIFEENRLQSGSVATLQVPRDRLAGCFSWPLRFAVYSSGANLNRRSSCLQSAGI